MPQDNARAALKHRSITRGDWERVTRSRFAWHPLKTPALRGAAALLRIDAVTSPLTTALYGGRLVLADKGYAWLQVAPAERHWWLTAAFDAAGALVQYYFDVTLENHIDGAASGFTDLYLDVVALPDGSPALLDQDELDEALRLGHITSAEYDLAAREAAALLAALPGRMAALNRFARAEYEALDAML